MRIAPLFNFNIDTKRPKGPNYTQTPYGIQKDSFERTTPTILRTQPSFGEFACTTEKFKPRNLYDMPCASCGKKTLRRVQVESFANNVKDKTGEDLIKALAQRRSYYGKIEKIVTTDLVKCAVDFPNENIASLIKRTSKDHKSQLENEQIEVMNNLKLESERLGEKDSKILQDFIDRAKKGIKYSSEEAYFKRKAFLSELAILGKSFEKQDEFQEIFKLAETLPTSKDSISAFYVKYSRRSSEEIAMRLLITSQATTEHILPQSLEGGNISSNYMVMCGDCNSKRSSIPYSEWMKVQPKMPENFKAYIDEVILRIKNGELAPHWSTYPYEVCKTMARETNGAISVSVDEDIARVKSQPEIEDRTATLEARVKKASAALKARKLAVANLERRKEELSKDEQYKTIVKYYILQKNIAGLIESKRALSGQLNEAKKRKEAHLRRTTDLAALEQGFQDGSLSIDEKSARNKIKTLKIKLKKTKGAEHDTEKLQAKYDEINLRLEQKSNEKNAVLEVINLPETLRARRLEIKKQLETNPSEELETELKHLTEEQKAIQEKIDNIEISEKIESAKADCAEAQEIYDNLCRMFVKASRTRVDVV